MNIKSLRNKNHGFHEHSNWSTSFTMLLFCLRQASVNIINYYLLTYLLTVAPTAELKYSKMF